MPAESPPRIRILADQVCNQIAAGEVIERPASVFKELVENAVDAGASEIQVEVLQGGRKAVIVTDDGCGMDKDSCLLAVERHATSKIQGVEDIERIRSMGFRGEALAAIPSVSRFTLESRPKDHLSGTRVQIDGGKLADVSETGCPVGTRIEVRNLFFNTPARRKFLRTEATELAYIRTLFHTFAIAHPEVALRLVVDGKTLETLPAQVHLADRIADVHGAGILDQLRPVEWSRGDIRVHGFIGLPTLHRNDRRDQITLINRRPATAPVLGYAIREAYADSIPKGRHPVLFLHLDMPVEWVDVNVHPTKREVRFGPSQLIRDAVMEAIGSSLRVTESVTVPEARSPVSPEPLSTPPEARSPVLEDRKRQPNLPPTPADYPPLPPTVTPPQPAPPVSAVPAPPSEPSALPVQTGPETWSDAEYFGACGGFHFCALPSGIIVLLPKAARERILYEQSLQEWEQGTPSSQRLLLPETITCTPEEARRIREQLDDLNGMGFELAEFDGDAFLVEAVPGWMQEVPVPELLKTLGEQPETSSQKGASITRERLAKRCSRLVASRSSTETPESCLNLLTALARCDMPYTTPFGRPTLLHMGVEEFRRKFGLS